MILNRIMQVKPGFSWPALICIIFIVSRLTAYACGVIFNMGFFTWGAQCLDIPLLQNKLWESIWYMHGQPPLFNLYIAAVINLFPDFLVKYVFQLCFLGFGLLHSLLLYKLLRELYIPMKICVLITLYFMLSPAAVLYENLFYYTQIELLLLTLSAWLLARFLKQQTFINAFLFFLTLAVLILTRSMFHWVWLLGFVMVLLALLPAHRNILLLAALIPLVLSGGWFYKNYVLYGKFASSSWLGMSLANVVKPQTGIAQKPRWKGIETYEDFIIPDTRFPGIEVLHTPYQSDSMVNLNYLPYLQVFDQFLEESVKKIKSEPGQYFYNVLKGHYLYFNPAANYDGLSDNRPKINIYAALYDLSFLNALYKRFTGKILYQPAFYIAIANILILLLSLRLCLLWVFSGNQEKRFHAFIMLYLLYNIAYIDFTGNFFEYSENVRFRFITIPSTLVLSGILLNYYLPHLSKFKWVKKFNNFNSLHK